MRASRAGRCDSNPTAAPSAAHPDASIQSGEKSTKETEASGSFYTRYPTVSGLKTKPKKTSKLESFKSSWTEPPIKEILYLTLMNSTLL